MALRRSPCPIMCWSLIPCSACVAAIAATPTSKALIFERNSPAKLSTFSSSLSIFVLTFASSLSIFVSIFLVELVDLRVDLRVELVDLRAHIPEEVAAHADHYCSNNADDLYDHG